jgi:uridine phosphorylase
MRENVSNWLLGPKRKCLCPRALVLFGNPYLFQRDAFLRHFSQLDPVGLFHNATYGRHQVTFCYPLFGAPMTAMYAEVMMRNGVRRIVACGYVGGIAPEATIGGYGLISSARGFDGTTASYGIENVDLSATTWLVDALSKGLIDRKTRYHQGAIASIDALMLEDDGMIGSFLSSGYEFIDLETASLFAIAKLQGTDVAALHIVTDNPTRKEIDATHSHEASFDEQIELALAALVER